MKYLSREVKKVNIQSIQISARNFEILNYFWTKCIQLYKVFVNHNLLRLIPRYPAYHQDRCRLKSLILAQLSSRILPPLRFRTPLAAELLVAQVAPRFFQPSGSIMLKKVKM